MGKDPDHLTSEPKAILMTLASGVAFGTLAIFAKFAYRKGAEFVPLLVGRFVVATFVLVLFALLTKKPLRLSARTAISLIAIGGIGYAFEASLFYAALERAPAAVVGLIFYSYPMWTVIMGIALKIDLFNKRVLLALILGTTGVLIIFTIPRAEPDGMLLALAAALAVAVYFTLVQVAMRDVEPVAGAAWTTGGAALTLGVITIVTQKSLPMEAAPEMVGMGLMSALAFALMYQAIGVIGSAKASIVMMVEPVATLLLAAALLGEKITPRVIVGALVILAALPVLTRKTAPPEPI